MNYMKKLKNGLNILIGGTNMTSEIYDIVSLASDLELDYTDITDLYVSYIDEINDHCDKLQKIYYKKDFAELKNEIHNVKGVAANLLIKDVFDEASSFEKLLKHGDFADSKEHLKNLSNLVVNSKDKIIRSFADVNIIL